MPSLYRFRLPCSGARLTSRRGALAALVLISLSGPGCKPRAQPLTGAVEIVASSTGACARLGDGRVACWGRLSPASPDEAKAATVFPGLADVKQIVAGDDVACARVGDGSVLCWGQNLSGGLGAGNKYAHMVPVRIQSVQKAVEIAGADAHFCARQADGAVLCWGDRYGDAEPIAPTPVSGLEGAVQLSVSRSRGCALVNDGIVRCWGTDNTAVPVAGLANVAQVVVHNECMMAVKKDGSVVVSDDAAGSCRFTKAGANPMAKPPPLADIARITCQSHCMAFSRSGGVWGANDLRSETPPDGTTEVAMGSSHRCYLVAGGAVQCSGLNSFGALGAGPGAAPVDFAPVPVVLLP